MRHEAGKTSIRVLSATRLPFRMRAATSRSSRRPLVHEPMTIWWTFLPATSPIGFTLSTVCGQAIWGSSAVASISSTRS